MSKITRGNIAAARAQRDILIRRGKPVPEIVEKLARLDPDKLKPSQSVPTRVDVEVPSESVLQGLRGLAQIAEVKLTPSRSGTSVKSPRSHYMDSKRAARAAAKSAKTGKSLGASVYRDSK